MLLSSSQQIACERLRLFIRGSKKSPDSRARKETREQGVEKNFSATRGSCVLSPLSSLASRNAQLARRLVSVVFELLGLYSINVQHCEH